MEPQSSNSSNKAAFHETLEKVRAFQKQLKFCPDFKWFADSNYGDIEQRWLLVYSQQSYEREKQTFEKKLGKQDNFLNKAMWNLSNEIFPCEKKMLKNPREK